jgi:hypothetical protein
VPSCIAGHEQDDAAQARSGFAGKGFEQSLEKFLRHTEELKAALAREEKN